MNKITRIWLTGLLFSGLLCALPPTDAAAQSEAPVLSLPVDCTIGEDCWVVNYPDHDTTSGVKDTACGARSYDGHKGVDIALPDRITMYSGVDVLAPADGEIVETRNTVADHDGSKENVIKARQSGQECGNKISLYLGNGWGVDLCHLKQGSVTVKAGDKVKRGQKLAQVGLSGMSQFAHLHIGLSHHGLVFDPFTGVSLDTPCTTDVQPDRSLWTNDAGIAYSPVDLFAAGFSNTPPEYKQLKESTYTPHSLPLKSPLLAFWAMGFGMAPGDTLDITITDPRGKVFASHHQVHDRNSSQYMYWTGKKTQNTPLIAGAYTANAQLTRKLPDGSTVKRHIKRQVIIR